MGETEGRFDIDALIAGLRGRHTSFRCMVDAANALERLQAVVRVLRSMDRRGLLEKELRDAIAALDAPPEGDG